MPVIHPLLFNRKIFYGGLFKASLNEPMRRSRGEYENALEAGFSPLGLTYSPVKGPEGNIEYLLYLRRDEIPQAGELPDIAALVEESHRKLNGGDGA